MFVIDLLQSFFGGSLQLEFHYIDEMIGLQDEVNASLWGMILCFYIESNEFKYDEEYILIM